MRTSSERLCWKFIGTKGQFLQLREEKWLSGTSDSRSEASQVVWTDCQQPDTLQQGCTAQIGACFACAHTLCK